MDRTQEVGGSSPLAPPQKTSGNRGFFVVSPGLFCAGCERFELCGRGQEAVGVVEVEVSEEIDASVTKRLGDFDAVDN